MKMSPLGATRCLARVNQTADELLDLKAGRHIQRGGRQSSMICGGAVEDSVESGAGEIGDRDFAAHSRRILTPVSHRGLSGAQRHHVLRVDGAVSEQNERNDYEQSGHEASSHGQDQTTMI